MPMKRRLSKQRDTHITPRAIEIFDAMRAIRCSCDPDDCNTKCAGCKRRDDLDEQLMFELKLTRVVYPTIEDPLVRNPYPPGTHGHKTWQPDYEAQERWRALEAASREARARKSSAENSAEDVAATDTRPLQ